MPPRRIIPENNLMNFNHENFGGGADPGWMRNIGGMLDQPEPPSEDHIAALTVCVNYY